MEMLELVGLVVVVAVMGPAVRRVGRNNAHDLLPTEPRVAMGLLRLVDVAYYFVFTGVLLITNELDFGRGVVNLLASRDLAQQLEETAIRFGGLLLVMGVLHAMTLLALPVVALVHNSTRRGRALPRWLHNAGVIVAVLAVWQLIGIGIALLVAGLS
jgi:hypothetical protein